MHLIPDPDELVAARQLTQPLDGIAERRIAQVGPADHADHERRRMRKPQEFLGLVQRGPALHHDAGVDLVLVEQRREIGRAEAAPDRSHLVALHPGIVGQCRVPEMLMRIDADGHGASPGNGDRGSTSSRARSSCQNAGGTCVFAIATLSAASTAERAPCSATVTAGCASTNWIAAALSDVPCCLHSASSSLARATNAASASS